MRLSLVPVRIISVRSSGVARHTTFQVFQVFKKKQSEIQMKDKNGSQKSRKLNSVSHRFTNWGTRTPRGTQSGSGGTRGEHFRDNRKRTEFAECTV